MIVSFLPPRKVFSHSHYVLFALTAILASACGWSQTQLGTVFGTITDPSGAVISGAKITVSNENNGLKRDAVTDVNGQYYILGLPTGEYSLRVDKEGFQTAIREGIAISTATAVGINSLLQVATLPQQVTTTADNPSINTTTSTVIVGISGRSLTELPLNGRDLFRAAILEPGVAPTPSSAPSLLSNGKAAQVLINGMRPSWMNVLIDGMDANDPVFGYSPAGASGLFLGLDEFAEVSLLTQTFNSDYGNHAAGSSRPLPGREAISFTDLFELHRDAAFDAKNYFDVRNLRIPEFVRNQFGASVWRAHGARCRSGR